MGTLVLSASRADTKPNYVVSTVAFGSVAVADGELGVFIGANVAPQVSNYNGLGYCLDTLKETYWPDPGTGVTSDAIYDVVTRLDTDTLSENTVAIIKGSGYSPAGVSQTAHANRMLERWLEDVAKDT